MAAITAQQLRLQEGTPSSPEGGGPAFAEEERDLFQALHISPELVRMASSGDWGSIEHIKTAHKIRELKFRVQNPGEVQDMDISSMANKLGMSEIEANACHIAFLAYDLDGSGELDLNEADQAFAGAMADMPGGVSMKWNVHFENGTTRAYTQTQFAKKFGARE